MSRLGIDWRQVRGLLAAYGAMSKRGRSARAFRSRSSAKGESRWGFALVLFMYVMFGGCLSGMAPTVDLFTFALLVHGVTFVLLGMNLTSESGELLFNPGEQDVLGPLPVSPRTLLTAKALNFFRLALALAGAFNLIPTLAVLATHGATWWSPLAHMLAVVLLAALCVALVVLVYLLLIRLAGRRRFDAWSSWLQVASSVGFVLGYQVLITLPQRLGTVAISPAQPLFLALPPAWSGALEALLSGQTFFGATPALVLMGGVTSVLLGALAWGRLAGGYGELVARDGVSSPRPARQTAAAGAPARPPFLVRPWLRDPVERGVFQLVGAYLWRDRDTRLRLYPSLAIYLIFPLLGLLNPTMSGFYPLFTAWMLVCLPVTAMLGLSFSSHPEAADLFATAPIQRGAALFHGVRKATLYYLLLPLGALVLGLLWLCSGPESVLMALPALLAAPVISLLPGLGGYVPFSRQPTQGQQASRNMGAMWIAMLSGMVAVGGAWLSHKLGLLALYLAVEALMALLLFLILSRVLEAGTLPQEA